MSSIQATRLRKGMLIKIGNDLFRILDSAAFHTGQQARFHPGPDAQHPDVDAGRPEVPRGGRRRTGDARRKRNADISTTTAITTISWTRQPTSRFTSAPRRSASRFTISFPTPSFSVEFCDVEPVGIELPQTVDLVVKETVPGIKGATASAQVKPATLETGLVIQVPPFVNEGDKVRVNTETGEYQSRV